jgi:hypothetical protein
MTNMHVLGDVGRTEVDQHSLLLLRGNNGSSRLGLFLGLDGGSSYASSGASLLLGGSSPSFSHLRGELGHKGVPSEHSWVRVGVRLLSVHVVEGLKVGSGGLVATEPLRIGELGLKLIEGRA